jgi:glycine dehydrogenase subunit 1
MTRYTSATDLDRERMLAAIGVGSVEELFADVPEELRLGRPLALEDGLGEAQVYERLRALAERNADAESELCFLGGGMYDHYVPAIVDAITSRSEFLTPYTPYQPEISQGGLQTMFEFQTAISELTALPVSSAGLYEGPSSVAAAGYLAIAATGRRRLVTSAGLHPHSRAALETHSRGYEAEVVELPLSGGLTDLEALAAALDDRTAAVLVQNPNYLGAIEDLGPLAEVAHGVGALLIASCDPISLGVLRPPGEAGADVAVGEGQPLGGRLDYGGPSFGFFCAREEHLRRMPGRIAGETADVDGRRGFVLALQTREQHIRRGRATHNICTAQALNALAGMIYLSWLGQRGLVELGELLARRTAYARGRLSAVAGVEPLGEAPVLREFAVSLEAPVGQVLSYCGERGVAAGIPLGPDYPEHERGLLIAITEQRSIADIERLAVVLEDAIADAGGANVAGAAAGTVAR